MPARLRVSGLCPLCWQQGALNDVQPDGLDLARGGSSVRNLSTTRVILQVYYLYSILSTVPVLFVAGMCLTLNQLYLPVTFLYCSTSRSTVATVAHLVSLGVAPCASRLACISTVPV